MKRMLILFLVTTLMLLSGCNKKVDKPSLILPSGSPLVSVANILDNTEYQIVSGPTLFPAEFMKHEKDIIIAPIVIGVKLYNSKVSRYQLDSVLGFGNLYIVSRGKINQIDELSGKNIIAYGEHATPGIILRTATTNVNVNITYYDNVSDVVGPFKMKKFDYALISEPILQTLLSSTDEKFEVLDLSMVDSIPIICQFGVFINPDSVDKKDVNLFLAKIEANIISLNNDSLKYINDAIENVSELSKFDQDILIKSIPRSNISYLKAHFEEPTLTNFINFLNSKDQGILGGKMPDEGFYNQ